MPLHSSIMQIIRKMVGLVCWVLPQYFKIACWFSFFSIFISYYNIIKTFKAFFSPQHDFHQILLML